MVVPLHDFATRVATECRSAARRLMRLQDTLGEGLTGRDVTGQFLQEVQALDAINQTLEDLAQVFEELAQSDGVPVSHSTISAARQLALRHRLTGEVDKPSTEGDEMF